MKKVIIILSILIVGCGANKILIKNTSDYPNEIIVHEIEFTGDTVNVIYYPKIWDENTYYQLWIFKRKYNHKNINIGDTITLQKWVIKKYLKAEIWHSK